MSQDVVEKVDEEEFAERFDGERLVAFVVGVVVDNEVTGVESWLGNWRKGGVPDRRVVNHGEICGGCRAVIFRKTNHCHLHWDTSAAIHDTRSYRRFI